MACHPEPEAKLEDKPCPRAQRRIREGSKSKGPAISQRSGGVLLIGLTGGLGTGKSTVGEMLRCARIEVVDTDAISHALMVPGHRVFDQVVESFGAEILTVSGAIDRTKLAAVVFHDLKKRKILEEITHPAILEEVACRAAVAGEKGIACFVVEATLLYESGFDQQCAAVIVVSATAEQQRERTRKQRHYSDSYIDAVLKAQMPLAEKVRRATFVIDNSGTLDSTQKQVEELHKKLLEMATSFSFYRRRNHFPSPLMGEGQGEGDHSKK